MSETRVAPRARLSAARTNVLAGQWRWRWDLNPRKTCAFTRFRVLRTTVHHRPGSVRDLRGQAAATGGEWPRTGVNETKTETRARTAGPPTGRPLAYSANDCRGASITRNLTPADHLGCATVSPDGSGGWFGAIRAPGRAQVGASATGAAVIWVCRLPGVAGGLFTAGPSRSAAAPRV